MVELDIRTDEEKRLLDEEPHGSWLLWYAGLVDKQCYYCGSIIQAADVKPTWCRDRVPQCWFCNNAKHNNRPATFIAVVHDILHHLSDPTFASTLTKAAASYVAYSTWARSCERRGYGVYISEEQRRAITSQPCTYCGLSVSNGIDRIDRKNDYEMGKIQPCCKTCNYMKFICDHDDFVARLRAVAAQHPDRPVAARPVAKRRKIKRKK
jgi:hypothetical protein